MTQTLTGSISTAQPANHSFRANITIAVPALLVFTCLALVAYILPALTNTGAALTLNSYDLAEWTTLHPAATANNLLVALALRVQPVIIGILLIINLKPNRSAMFLMALLMLLLITFAQLPPIEFLDNRENPNYQQQLFLSLFTLFTALIASSGILYRVRSILSIGLLISGTGSYVWGVSQASTYMQQYSISGATGTGAILLIAVYAGLLILTVGLLVKANRTA